MKSFVFCSLLLAPLFAQSATITAEFSSNSVALNEMISIDLIGDFSDEIIVGGIVDISYDTDTLSRVSTTLNSEVWFPSFSNEGLDDETGITDFEFGRFFFDFNPSVDSGPVNIATLVFDAISIGQTDILLQGGLAENGVLDPVPLESIVLGSVQVVPLPASVWLFGSAFFSLLGIGNRKFRKAAAAA